jgi:hypothetical protein
MGWFRSNKRFGGWFALFALTIQLALSFGHVHVANLVWPAPVFALQADQAPPTSPDQDAVPSKPAAKLSFDYCGICALINLAGSLITPAAPALPLPTLVGRIEPWESASHPLALATYRAFQARAPPQA